MNLSKLMGAVFLLVSVMVSLAAAREIPERWIAVFADDEADPHGRSDSVARDTGVERGAVWSHAIKGFSFRGSPQAAAAVSRRPGVSSVEPDQTVEAFCHDPSEPQEVPLGIDRVGATANATALINGLDDVRVNADIAILDTGIYPHGDLNEEGGTHWNCASYKGCKAGAPKDDNGHGTHVAGTAAAIDNGRGVVGVAPGARLWSIKVLGRNGSGAWSWIISGLDLVAANASLIDVVNMSLGGSSTESASNCNASSLHKAVCGVTNAGVPIAVAAGNETADAAGSVPAKYDQVITVSALDAGSGNGVFASFSNFGAAVDLAAPGVGVLSTWPGDRQSAWGYCANADGTSMASPHVAGAIALYVASHGRDCNGSGGLNFDDVACIRNYLASKGECPNGASPIGGVCASAWPGDTDGGNEPLVSVDGSF